MNARLATCLTLAVTLTGAGALPGAAQSAEGTDSESGRHREIFFTAGWQTLPVDDLNERTAAAGLPSSPDDFFAVGAGMWLVDNRLILGAEASALLGSRRAAPERDLHTELYAVYGQLDLGYRAVEGSRLAVTPVLGLGAGLVALELFEQTTSGFDDVLNEPPARTEVTADGFVVDVAVMVQSRLGRRMPGHERAGGWPLGFRIGYAYSPGMWHWEVGDVEAPGGPSIGIRGAYLRLVLGGW